MTPINNILAGVSGETLLTNKVEFNSLTQPNREIQGSL